MAILFQNCPDSHRTGVCLQMKCSSCLTEVRKARTGVLVNSTFNCPNADWQVVSHWKATPFDVRRCRGAAMSANPCMYGEKVAKVCNLGHTNVAFLPLQSESSLSEMAKDFSEVLLMVPFIGRVYQHIV